MSAGDSVDHIAANAAFRHELERIATMSILPSVRKGSLFSPDSVRTGMEPAIDTIGNGTTGEYQGQVGATFGGALD